MWVGGGGDEKGLKKVLLKLVVKNVLLEFERSGLLYNDPGYVEKL